MKSLKIVQQKGSEDAAATAVVLVAPKYHYRSSHSKDDDSDLFNFSSNKQKNNNNRLFDHSESLIINSEQKNCSQVMLGQFVDQAYSLGDSNNKTGIFDHSKSCSQKFANLISDRHDKDKKVKKHFEDIAIVGCSPQGGDGGLIVGQKSDRDNCTNKLS